MTKSPHTLDELLRWLEDDGHAGCAEDLALDPTPATAERVATHVQQDPYFDDAQSRALPEALRQWAERSEAGR